MRATVGMLKRCNRFLALLRGMNVGGRNKMAMADLREIAVSLGYVEVRTYIQSGNLIFSGPDDEPGEIAQGLMKAIAARIGIDCRVVALTRGELAQVIEQNPFPPVADPRHLHAVLRQDDPGSFARSHREGAASGPPSRQHGRSGDRRPDSVPLNTVRHRTQRACGPSWRRCSTSRPADLGDRRRSREAFLAASARVHTLHPMPRPDRPRRGP